MNDWLRDLFRDRPVWINALMIFSSYMAFIYMPWDIFWKPVSEDVEVWFGIMFTGWWAKLMAFPIGSSTPLRCMAFVDVARGSAPGALSIPRRSRLAC